MSRRLEQRERASRPLVALLISPAKRTLRLALPSFQGQFVTNYPLLFTGVILSSLPIVIAYVALQRQFVAGITAGAGK